MGKIKNLIGLIKDFWTEYYEDIVLGITVFLLVSLAFGIGIIVGSKFYEQASININCPESFWER